MIRIANLYKSRRLRYTLLVGATLPILFALAGWWLLPPLDPAGYLHTPASGQLLDREGQRLYVALNERDAWSLPQPYEGLSPYLLEATLAAEDQRFYQHPGVDPVAIVRAAGQNLRQGGVASGASTLTMQLVKLGGHNSASLRGKLGQAVYVLRLEKSLDKESILRGYLNKAPYGMNLLGAEAAAWRYVGKTARTLSLSEAALLAGLPKAPSRLNPLAHPERAQVRRDYVLRRMFAEGYIETVQRDRALATPVRAEWHDFPRHAPHLGTRYRDALAHGEVISLTLDGALQRDLEATLPHYLKRFDRAITNGAIMVVDVHTGALLARVGSASFEDTPGGGQVDGCRALRSPGSTLKPFLYGFAMAQQQLYPTEVLLDDVLDYGRYAPGNFDGAFSGPVTATEALRYSLNVPAVALLDRVGVAPFRGFLRDGGLTSINRSPADYGLGLALGNCEVSLEALTRLYLSVASLGTQNELRLRSGASGSGGARVFQPELARALYAMLAQPFPKELKPGLLRREGNDAPVCWKTGTSTGYHDAWTFAFNQHYLVAVWLGNNDGKGVRQLVGAYAALPLVAKVFCDLPPLAGSSWPPALQGTSVAFCAASGLPANEACAEQFSEAMPKGLWRHRRCTLHATSQTGRTVVASRPAKAADWDLASLSSRTLREDTKEGKGGMLAITSPANGAAYVLSGVPDGDIIQLAATVDSSETAHWFVDGRYVGREDIGVSLDWALARGEHTVVVQLADGRRDTSTFTVLRPSEIKAAR
ncbi:MAG: penicillin-binding protein 1C [Candidatus Hydrogenedentes bacterium]|nr:penicillin-binding protein 1C [Candidatus Hydrogenedentota bacterium]